MFAAVARYRWLRELRARWRWAAVLFLLALAGQYALTSPRRAVDLADLGPLPVAAGHAVVLRGVDPAGTLAGYAVRPGGGLDLRFEQARLAPETLALLAAAGVAAPTGEGPASWITQAAPGVGAEDGARLEAVAADPAAPPRELSLRPLPGATPRQARLELTASGGALLVTLALPWTGEPRAPRKILRLQERDLALPAGVPARLLVGSGQSWRMAVGLPAGAATASLDLGSFADRGGGLGLASLTVEGQAGGAAFLACAGDGGWLWRAAARLAAAACPAGPARLTLRRFDLGADGATLTLAGTAWAARDGVPLGDDLLARLRRQPLAWSLVLLVDALLLAWLLLALLPGPRRIALRGVFISYRRTDSAAWVGRLHDRLASRLGAGRIFLDVESIPAGTDFATFIAASLARVDVLLAVVGPTWAETRDAAGNRRLEAADDYVRCEIATALASGLRVIPVLVPGAAMPGPGQLPADLAPFAHLNAFPLTERSFLRDVDDLADQLEAAPSLSPASGG